MAGNKDSTGGATPAKGEAARAVAGVGGVRSSDDSALDLWWSGQPAEERRDATCSAGEKRREGRGDGPQGLTAPEKVRQLQITLYRKAKSKPEYRFWSLYGEVQRADVPFRQAQGPERSLRAGNSMAAREGKCRSGGSGWCNHRGTRRRCAGGSSVAGRAARGASPQSVPACAGAPGEDPESQWRVPPVGDPDSQRPGSALRQAQDRDRWRCIWC